MHCTFISIRGIYGCVCNFNGDIASLNFEGIEEHIELLWWIGRWYGATVVFVSIQGRCPPNSWLVTLWEGVFEANQASLGRTLLRGLKYAKRISPWSKQEIYNINVFNFMALWIAQHDLFCQTCMCNSIWNSSSSPRGTLDLHKRTKHNCINLYICEYDIECLNPLVLRLV